MIEKKVIVNTSMTKKVSEILESYNGEDFKFKCIDGSNPVKAVFQVTTAESDDEKLIRKVKDIIKADKFGSVLYFSVTLE